jgi:hypothetical protein
MPRFCNSKIALPFYPDVYRTVRKSVTSMLDNSPHLLKEIRALIEENGRILRKEIERGGC